MVKVAVAATVALAVAAEAMIRPNVRLGIELVASG
jgi:hypothetical protein